MQYQGGSILTGNTVEKLHEITVKNHYAARHARKKLEEIKTQTETPLVMVAPVENVQDAGEPIQSLDQTFDSTSASQQQQYNYGPGEYAAQGGAPAVQDPSAGHVNQYGDYYEDQNKNAAYNTINAASNEQEK